MWIRVRSIVLLTLTGFAAPLRGEPPTVGLWALIPPGGLRQVSGARAVELRKEYSPNCVCHLDHPTRMLFLLKGQSPHPAMVVCQVGGYSILAWDLEGVEVAKRLYSLGMSAVVLKYRVPRRSTDSPLFKMHNAQFD